MLPSKPPRKLKDPLRTKKSVGVFNSDFKGLFSTCIQKCSGSPPSGFPAHPNYCLVKCVTYLLSLRKAWERSFLEITRDFSGSEKKTGEECENSRFCSPSPGDLEHASQQPNQSLSLPYFSGHCRLQTHQWLTRMQAEHIVWKTLLKPWEKKNPTVISHKGGSDAELRVVQCPTTHCCYHYMRGNNNCNYMKCLDVCFFVFWF